MHLTGWLNSLRWGWVRASSRCGQTVRRRVAIRVEPLEVRQVLAEDFGDAPDTGSGTGRGNYETLLANGGPHHTIVAGLKLGTNVDGEANATANNRASGDDSTTSPDDEDGVVNPLADLQWTVGSQPAVTLRATNTTGTAATLFGWIDYNANGIFDNTTERAQVAVSTGTNNSLFTLTFPVVPTGYTGTTYARFRLSTDLAAANATGAATNGEVEDYAVTITSPSDNTVKTGGTTKLASGGSNMPTLANYDSFGHAVANLGDIDGDGIADLAVGAEIDSTGGTQRGAVHILFLNANGTVKGTTKLASGTNGGPALVDRDRFGRSVSNIGDLDGDGVTDLAVGATGDDTGSTDRGAVYILFLNSDGTAKSNSKIASGTGGGPTLSTSDFFGTSVQSVGDLDGDGIVDLAVGAARDDTGGSDRGAVHILFLNSDGTAKSTNRIASGTNGGPILADKNYFGNALANLGDLDGDGVSDLAVGAYRDQTNGSYRGAVHILFLTASGTVKTSRKIASGTNGGPTLANADFFGASLANVGDLDGDGVVDLAVGAQGDDTGGDFRGAIYLLNLRATGTANSVVKIASGTNGGPTLANRDYFGAAVTNLGDLDGDGVTDIAVGANGDDTGGSYRGAVHILRLNAGTALRDFGDAQDTGTGTGRGNYKTLTSDSGPSHGIVNGLLLGARINGESDALQSAWSNGDDIGIDDEDGLVNPLVDLQLTVGTQPNVTLRATNTTGAAATLYGWIDYNANGVFENATERAQIGVPTGSNNGLFTLTFPVVPSGYTGTTYARFRLSTDVAAANSTGAAANGEVEDYLATVSSPTAGTVKSGGVTKLASDTTNGPLLFSGDAFGSAVVTVGDLDGNGTQDLAVGTYSDDSGGPDRGAVSILFMTLTGSVLSTTKIASGFNGGPSISDSARFGGSLAAIGDLDGDGVNDLAVGAYVDNTGGNSRGAVYVLFLNASGTVKASTKIASGTGGGPTLADSDYFGRSVASVGDLDGDGVTDLAVGASKDDSGGADRGAVYLLFMKPDGTARSSVKISSGSNGGPTLADGDRFGISVAGLKDLNQDGIPDLVVGAIGDDAAGNNRGAAYVLFMAANGTVLNSTKLGSGTGGGPALANDDAFGFSVAAAGDLDGDGISDLLVGAGFDDTNGTNRGAIYVLLLNASGSVKSSSKIASSTGGGAALANNDAFGSSIAMIGDLDRDGIVDLAVGTPQDDTGSANSGAVYILRLEQLNVPPTAILLTTNSIDENLASPAVIGNFSTTDPNTGNTFTYTLVTGAGSTDNGSFTIAGTQLQSNAIFDFEAKSTYSIRVRSTDQGNLSFEQTFIISVNNVNEPPTVLGLSANLIAEKLPSGAAVGSFTTTDPDSGNTFTYTLVTGSGSTDNASFLIVGNQLQSNAVFDFEAKPAYSIRVRATDQGNLSIEQTFTINVTNVNEQPTAMNLSSSSIAENQTVGTTVGTFSTTDPDVGNTFTYTLVSGAGSSDNSSFTINGSTLKTNAVLDFEGSAFLSIRVRTTDQDGLSFERSFTIFVDNTNDSPVLDNSGNPYYIAGVGKRLPSSLTNGILITDLLATGAGGNPITDPDSGSLKGIAITAIDKTFGKWQFSTVASPASDSDWTDVDAGTAVSDSSALLLKADATTRIRMISTLTPHHEGTPNQGFIPLESKLTSGITFRAWDQTTGTAGQRGNTSTNGGTSAFSTASETLNVFFEARLWRSFNTNASLNVYTLEAEFNALTANPAYQDRATGAYTGFTIFLSPLLATLPTASLYRMYYGVQFNDDGTETDMGYRYLTTSEGEAQNLEGLGRADKRPQRAGAYFREQGVNNGTGIIGYIYSTSQPGTAEMSQIYRTDLADKPTRPAGTVEGAPPTTQKLQEQGDHVYTTNKAFEKTKTPGTLHVDGVSLGWREEAARGFVRELTPNPSLQLPVNSPMYGDETGSDATGSVSTTTSITVSPSLATILLPETLLTGLYAATATSVTAPVSVGLIAVPPDAGPCTSDVEVHASTANDSAESTPGEINDTVYELVPEADSIDQFWQSIATSLEPALLV